MFKKRSILKRSIEKDVKKKDQILKRWKKDQLKFLKRWQKD